MTSTAQLVSVIVPTRNSARTLDACLGSIRNQEYTPVELIVVDNQSTDDTVQIATGRADVVDHWGPERSAQRNRGAFLAHGPYLLFIDSDMELAPRVVDDCVDAIRSSEAPAVVIPEVSFGAGFLAHCRALERSCYVGDDSVEAARFFLRDAFNAVGGFDENLQAFEDWDLSIRVAAGTHLSRTSSYISHNEGRLRLGAVLAKKRRYAKSALYYWRKHGHGTLRGANLVFRPALVRSWRRLLRHPLLACGILTLRTLETGAGAWGVTEEWLGERMLRESASTKSSPL